MSLVEAKACLPIVVTVAGITSVPARSVAAKAPSPISTSEVASDKSRPVSLVSVKAEAPMVLTAAPTLSVLHEAEIETRENGCAAVNENKQSEDSSAGLVAQRCVPMTPACMDE